MTESDPYSKFEKDENIHQPISNSVVEEEISKILSDAKIPIEYHESLKFNILKVGMDAFNGLEEDIALNKIKILKNSLESNEIVRRFLEPSNFQPDADKKSKILTILKETKIEDEDGLHNRIVNILAKSSSLSSLNEFSEFLSKKTFTALKERLKVELEFSETPFESVKTTEANKNQETVDQELNESTRKYRLQEKLNMELFSKLETFSNNAHQVKILQLAEKILHEYEFSHDNQKFASSIFELFMYLIKRQQSLLPLMQKLNRASETCKKFTLTELVYNLMMNADRNLRIRILCLLSTKNPVPVVNYYKSLNGSFELKFLPEVYINKCLHQVLIKKWISS